MKLELGYVKVTDVCLGAESKFEDGVVTVDVEAVRKMILENDKIADVQLDVAKPGESTRITPVKDVIQPRVKVEGPGGVFPGVINKVDTVGSGKTYALEGMGVIIAPLGDHSAVAGIEQEGVSAADQDHHSQQPRETAAAFIEGLHSKNKGMTDGAFYQRMISIIWDEPIKLLHMPGDGRRRRRSGNVSHSESCSRSREKARNRLDKHSIDGRMRTLKDRQNGLLGMIGILYCAIQSA